MMRETLPIARLGSSAANRARRLRHRAEIAEGLCPPIIGADRAMPLVGMFSVSAAIDPVGVVRHGGDANEQVAMAHHLGERERRDILDIDDCSPLRPVGGRGFRDGRIDDAIEAELVGRQIEIGLRIGDLGIIAAGARCPEFGDEACRGSTIWVGWSLGVSAQIRCVTIQPLRRASAELVLLDDMPGKTVRIGAGAPFGVGDEIHFPVRLLERLRDTERASLPARPSPPRPRSRSGARADLAPSIGPACRRRRSCRRPTMWRPGRRRVHVPDQPAARAPTSGCSRSVAARPRRANADHRATSVAGVAADG